MDPRQDPRQGPADSNPTQQLRPGTPGWGPAAQVPGHLPPPPPAQPPGATSAWSQQLPPAPPQYGPPGAPGAPRGSARPWLIGGGAALAVAAIVGVIIATSGGGGKSDASGTPGVPGAPGGTAKPSALAPAEKTFTHVPDGCSLIKASTIASIAPGAACTPSQFDNTTMAAMITKMPRWESPSGAGELIQMNVHLQVSATAKSFYGIEKQSALNVLGKMATITDSRSLSGLGEEAYVVHATEKSPFDGGEAHVIVREGNAEFSVGYTYSNSSGPAKTQQQAEDAAIAAARDVLGSLS